MDCRTKQGGETMTESEYWYAKINQDKINSDLQQQEIIVVLVQNSQLNLVVTLKPTLLKDGNQWCYLLGEDLMNGVAGFGNTPFKAAINFSENYYKP